MLKIEYIYAKNTLITIAIPSYIILLNSYTMLIYFCLASQISPKSTLPPQPLPAAHPTRAPHISPKSIYYVILKPVFSSFFYVSPYRYLQNRHFLPSHNQRSIRLSLARAAHRSRDWRQHQTRGQSWKGQGLFILERFSNFLTVFFT